ncbi:MAG TPA: hypothetical protein PLH27_04095, partial [bacterium]|nr:hypothetical protein [bacterium]
MKYLIVSLMALSGVWAQGKPEDAQSVIRKVQNKYKKTDSFSFSFDYRFKWKLTGKSQSAQGKLFFKKENNIRYELGQQLNITN